MDSNVQNNLQSVLESLCRMYPEVHPCVYVNLLGEDNKRIFRAQRLNQTMYFEQYIQNLEKNREIVTNTRALKSYKMTSEIFFQTGYQLEPTDVRLGFSLTSKPTEMYGIPITVSALTAPAEICCAISGRPVQSHIAVVPGFGTPQCDISEFTRLSRKVVSDFCKKYEFPFVPAPDLLFLPGERGVSFRHNDIAPTNLEILDLGFAADTELISIKKEPELTSIIRI